MTYCIIFWDQQGESCQNGKKAGRFLGDMHKKGVLDKNGKHKMQYKKLKKDRICVDKHWKICIIKGVQTGTFLNVLTKNRRKNK
jgi:hypothetical protein